MKRNMFFSVIVLMFFSCTSKSSITNGQTYEDSIRKMINKQFYRDSWAKSPKMTPEDSLMRIITKLYGTDAFVTKYYNVSKN